MSTTTEWSVYVRLASDVDAANEAHIDALGAIASALDEPHGAAISARGGDVDAQAWAKADDPASALEQVRAALAGAAVEHFTIGDVVEQHVRPWDEFASEIDQTTLPELVSGPEAAEILGVTRQRVQQLASEHPLFPEPVYQLGVGRLWLRVQVETFAKKWDRRPGRRPAAEQATPIKGVFVRTTGRSAGKVTKASAGKKAAAKKVAKRSSVMPAAARSRRAPQG